MGAREDSELRRSWRNVTRTTNRPCGRVESLPLRRVSSKKPDTEIHPARKSGDEVTPGATTETSESGESEAVTRQGGGRCQTKQISSMMPLARRKGGRSFA